MKSCLVFLGILTLAAVGYAQPSSTAISRVRLLLQPELHFLP